MVSCQSKITSLKLKSKKTSIPRQLWLGKQTAAKAKAKEKEKPRVRKEKANGKEKRKAKAKLSKAKGKKAKVPKVVQAVERKAVERAKASPILKINVRLYQADVESHPQLCLLA